MGWAFCRTGTTSKGTTRGSRHRQLLAVNTIFIPIQSKADNRVLTQICDVFRRCSNKSGIKTRVGVLNGKRVDYFKGRAAVKALLSPAYAKTKGVPPVADEAAAERTLHGIIPFAFFLRVDRGGSSGGKDSPKLLQVNQMQMFKGDLVSAVYRAKGWETHTQRDASIRASAGAVSNVDFVSDWRNRAVLLWPSFTGLKVASQLGGTQRAVGRSGGCKACTSGARGRISETTER